MQKIENKFLRCFLLTVVLICVGLTAIFIYAHIFFFEYDEIKGFAAWANDEEYQKIQEYKALGYSINYPEFHNSKVSVIFEDRSVKFTEYTGMVYHTINIDINNFVKSVVHDYKNYARLDYTVDVDLWDTITIEFYGEGSPDGTGEAFEPISKTFVYDIKGVSADNPPRLIS